MNRVLLLAALVLPLAAPAYAQRVVAGALVAKLPLEQGSWPFDAASRPVAKGEVVSLRSVPVREAVVMREAVQAGKRVLSPGLALARVTVEGSDIAAWCDLRAPNGLDKRSIDCLADTNGDGKPDRLAIGLTSTSNAPLSVSRLALDEEIAPAAIRPAKPAERPMATLGLRYCYGAGPTSAFAVAVKTEETDWADQDECAVLGAGGVKVAANPASGPKARTAQAPTDKAARWAQAQALAARPALLPAGPAQPGTGELKRGDAVLSIPVTHGITGRLRSQVGAGFLFPKPPLPAGQPVFGVPMTASRFNTPLSAKEVIWCAPRPVTRKDGKPGISTVCLPEMNFFTRWVEVGSSPFVDSMTASSSHQVANKPDVELGPVDLGAMALVYRFRAVKKDRVLLDVKVESELGSAWVSGPELPKLSNGVTYLPIPGGGVVQIRPAADGKSITAEAAQPFRQADGSRP
jgi:hypothetical protein